MGLTLSRPVVSFLQSETFMEPTNEPRNFGESANV